MLHFCCTLFSIITKNIKVNYTSVRQEAIFIKDTAGRLSKADLIVPETETGLQGFIGLKDDKTRKPLDIPEDGVIISRTYEKHHDIMELPKKMLIKDAYIQKGEEMTILAVSNNFSLLERLCNGLSSILPNANIIRETDSLMAGKYSFNHNFDMLFADVNMKRMGGVELIRFARQEHPGVLSYLIVPSGEKNDFPFLTPDEVTGIIEEPLTKESLEKALAQGA